MAVGEELAHVGGLDGPLLASHLQRVLVGNLRPVLLVRDLGGLELEVAKVQHARHDGEDGLHLIRVELEDLHAVLHVLEVLLVADAVHVGHARLVRGREHVGGLQVQFARHLRVRLRRREQLVEDVVVALALGLRHHAGLLQQVVDDAAADDGAVDVEVHRDQLAEARRVVVSI